MQKKHFLNLALWALIPMSLCVTGCSDDDTYPDVDGQTPVAEMNSLHIQSAAGRTFTIEGKLTDADGISTIQLQCADLYLNKTIDLIEIYGEPQTEYDLSYNFTTEREELGESFTITVTVTDVGGRSVSQDVLVTMDGDFAAPVFVSAPSETVNVLIRENTIYILNLTISDDRALSSVSISIPNVENYENYQLDANGQREITISERISLPSVVQNYEMTITAVDAVGNQSKTTCKIVVDELQDYERMYLADVATTEELNSDVFGVPMRIDHIGEYQYRAKYYSPAPNTEIFFLPQTNDFSPICFGLDPNDENILTSDSETAKPIVLAEGNVYYDITFNTLTGEYSMSTYSLEEAQDPWGTDMKYGEQCFDLWGNGSEYIAFTFGLTSDNPTGVKSFIQDETNPHLFYSEPMELATDEQMNFIIHNYHTDQWWNAVRWCSISETDLDVFNYYTQSASKNPAYTGPTTGQDVWSKPTVTTGGTYRFYFDSHLGRAKLVRE